MSKKTIQINPEFFTLSKKKKHSTKNTQKKIQPRELSKFVKPSTAKKQLLQMIKKHKQKHNNDQTIDISSNDVVNDVKSSLAYLENIVKSHKQKKKKKKVTNHNETVIHFDSPLQSLNNINEKKTYTPKNITIKKEPPYGCLKGGIKPTLSQYKKTIKHKNVTDNSIVSDQKTNNNIVFNKEKTLDKPIQTAMYNKPAHISEGKSIKKKIRTTTFKRKYKLGKLKDKRKISVLLKNKKTQKKIRDETKLLEKKSIPEIKKYLRSKNLIKIGSNAPDNVVREIYKNAMLSGEILNKSSDILLHNYMQKQD